MYYHVKTYTKYIKTHAGYQDVYHNIKTYIIIYQDVCKINQDVCVIYQDVCYNIKTRALSYQDVCKIYQDACVIYQNVCYNIKTHGH